MAPTDILPIRIGTHRYQMRNDGYTRRPLASLRQQIDQGMEPSEATFDNQGIWKRTQSDWQLGAGQEFFDQEDEADRRRFRTSKGLDVFNQRRRITLLPDVQSITTVGDGDNGVMVAAPGALWVASNTGVKYGSSPKSSMSTATGPTGRVSSMAVWGDYIYAADGNALRRAAATGGNFSTFGATTPDIVTVAQGRLICAEGNALYEVDNAGAKVGGSDFFTYPATGFVWRGFAPAPNGIYVWGDGNGYTEVYMISVVDATGDMAPPYPVMQTFVGETINAMTFYGGSMWIATTKGVRLAQINGSGYLTFGPLLEAPGNCKTIFGFDRFIYFGWTNFDGTSTGIGILNPEYFTKPMLPAYASHLMVTAQGTVYAGASYGGELYFAYDTGSALSIQAEHTTNKVSSGVLYSGGITYGTPERKAWLGVDAAWDTLPSGSSVTIEVLDGIGGTPVTVINASTSGKGEAAELPSTLENEMVELKVTLTRGATATNVPAFLRWTVRAQPLPFRAEEINLVLNLHKKIRLEAGPEIVQDPLAEFYYLQGLQNNRSRVPFEMGFSGETKTVMVDMIGILPDDGKSGLQNWDEQPVGWPHGWWTVRLITVEVV